jgi:hypothetical protein
MVNKSEHLENSELGYHRLPTFKRPLEAGEAPGAAAL